DQEIPRDQRRVVAVHVDAHVEFHHHLVGEQVHQGLEYLLDLRMRVQVGALHDDGQVVDGEVPAIVLEHHQVQALDPAVSGVHLTERTLAAHGGGLVDDARLHDRRGYGRG